MLFFGAFLAVSCLVRLVTVVHISSFEKSLLGCPKKLDLWRGSVNDLVGTLLIREGLVVLIMY